MDSYELRTYSSKLAYKTRRHLSNNLPKFYLTGINNPTNPYRTNTMMKTPTENTNVWWVEGVGP
jgi:hypothetical protein